ncbi:PepSY domain-containing protein [Cohnella hongkongensis]|uniref:PepSY domain-containing protein n=1 Tax=Cohnella hongkongensis TaxID=178337 RepID=A0ABV9FM80_9BACL
MMISKTRKILLSASLLSVVAIGAGAATTGFASNGGTERIGANKAKELAANAAGGQALRAELERENGVVYYEVDVLKDHREYDVYIEAYTGKTLKIERDDLDDDDWDDWDDRDDERRISAGSPSASPAPSAFPSPSASASKSLISREQASRIAAERVGGTVVKSELDKDDGVLYYEIELKTKRGEAEVDVHAYTGKILSVDYDDDDDDDDLYDD